MPYLIFPALFVNPDYLILPKSWGAPGHAIFLGITLAMYPLGQFFGSSILGALSDDYGRKKILWISLLGSAGCNCITGIALEYGLFALIVLSRFLAGFSEGNVAVARAMACDMKEMSKHEALGKLNAAISIAFFVGPFLGGMLAEITPATPFYLMSLLFVLLSIAAAGLLPITTVPYREKKDLWMRFNVPRQIRNLFKDKRLQFFMLVSTCFTLAIDIFYEFGPVYLTMKWMLCPSNLIVYNSVLCVALAIGNGYLAAFLAKRFPLSPCISGSIIGFSAILFGIVLTAYPPLMIVLFGLSGFFIGTGCTLLMVRISDSVADSVQGEVMGALFSLRVLGDALICLCGGVLLLISSKLILVLAACIASITMVYYVIMERQSLKE